jgi:hypothetical protein
MYCAELVSKVRAWHYFLQLRTLIYLSRCTAPADNLDGDLYGRRSRDHTEILVEAFELGVLWDEYGLVGDVIVRLLINGLCSFCYFVV